MKLEFYAILHFLRSMERNEYRDVKVNYDVAYKNLLNQLEILNISVKGGGVKPIITLGIRTATSINNKTKKATH